jgi:tRNA pseudouridine55 synthase
MARRGTKKIDGWLAIDKAAGMTSTQVIGRVRRITGAAKLGHGGTLDPMATGVLPIALGEATKTVPYVMDAEKRYRFTLRWGEARDTDDAEGEVIATSEVRPTEAQINAALAQFLGEIVQAPPAFSAIKIDGKRAYDLARAKEPVAPEPRIVRIDAFALVSIDDVDHATFAVTSGKGAYMRALARDLGRALGTCAHVSALRRLAVGPFTEEDAVTLEALAEPGALDRRLFPVETGLDLPEIALNEAQASYLRQGRPARLIDRMARPAEREIVLATYAGKPVALARYEAGEVHPMRVLNL